MFPTFEDVLLRILILHITSTSATSDTNGSEGVDSQHVRASIIVFRRNSILFYALLFPSTGQTCSWKVDEERTIQVRKVVTFANRIVNPLSKRKYGTGYNCIV